MNTGPLPRTFGVIGDHVLAESKNANLLPQFLEHITAPEIKDAYSYLVGVAAVDRTFKCYPEFKSFIRDFRFYAESGEQPFAFIVNQASLLFYFRAPAVRSGRYSLSDLKQLNESSAENSSGEWTVRLVNIGDVQRLWNYLKHGQHTYQSGTTPTTQIGYVNRNNQRCTGHRSTPGNDHRQLAYRMECLEDGCGQVYGSNGTDVFQRRCPKCQGGEPGLSF